MQFDPGLFLSSLLIVIIYVNDILIYGKTTAEVDKFIDNMTEKGVALHKEGTAKGYLGVDIKQDGNMITFTQEGLTKCIIKAMGLDTKHFTAKETPAESKALEKDIDGPPA